MKKFLCFFVVLILAGFLSFDGLSKDLKIGYVEFFKVFNDYYKTKEYDQALEATKAEREKGLDAKKEEIEKMQGELGLLKDEKQKAQQEKISQAIQDYRKLESEIFADLKKERDEKMKEIVEDIDKIVEGYAEKEKFDLILNEGAIIYGNKAIDLTSEIIKRVNEKQKK